ncbi:SpaA isopeptide-forming pilin-related protein, partial [uncultured Vagococcus sp.]|uniref:SpaA isopeptide-forming pilin-related protein n=1 Tax=uncultured Vagococcus sp. TaxID=189676 RepID=UPI00258554FF
MKSLKKWYSLFLVLVISVATIVQPIQVVSAVVVDSVLETTDSDEAATEISESNQKVETESIAEKTISDEKVVENNSKEVEKNKGAPVERQATVMAGKELNHAGFVDSISFEPKRVLGGKKINMIVTFDSKDTLKVLPGDKLTLTLPDELTAYYRENPVEVFMNGVVIGYAIVEEGKNKIVTIEFNDVVNDYQFITGGKLEMEVATRVLDNPSNQNIEESFSTNLGTDATPGDFILYSTPSGTGSKFFSKVGTIYTSNADQIYWFLRTNGDFEGYEGTDHSILDTLQVGQYRPSDFMTSSYGTFYTKNPETGKKDYLKLLTAQQLVDQGYLTVNIIDDMTTEFIFHHEKITDSVHIDFAFITRLTDEGKLMPEVENKAVSTHKREGEIKKEDDSSVVNPPSASGVVYPGKGILRILKVLNTNGKNSPLSGVVFDVFYENGQAVENAMDLTTDEKGQIVFPNLSPGNYYAIEKSAPDNASFDPSKKYEFTILDDDKGAILPVVNYAIIPEAKLEATKTADKKEVKVGDVITYTINATNTVKDSLLNPVVITDNLPEGLELVKDSVKASDKDAKVEVDGNNIKVTFNNVTGESSVNVTFEAKVTDKAGKTVKNVALVEGTDPNNP